MSTCHYQALPPIRPDGQEEIRFKCMEKPCVDTEVYLTSARLDKHATYFHNADHIETDMRAGYVNFAADGLISDEAQSPT